MKQQLKRIPKCYRGNDGEKGNLLHFRSLFIVVPRIVAVVNIVHRENPTESGTVWADAIDRVRYVQVMKVGHF